MPAPRFVAKLNRRLTNRVARRFAGRIPPFAIVVHRGRRSGTRFRTPVMVFPRDGAFLIALTYGSETDWVRNVMAAGGCTLEYRGDEIALTDPEICRGDPSSMPLPAIVRVALRLINMTEFLRLHRSGTTQPG